MNNGRMNNGATLGKGKRVRFNGREVGAKIYGAELSAMTCGAELPATSR